MLPFSIMKGKWIYGEIFAIAEGKTIYGEGFSIAEGKAIYGEAGASAVERLHVRPDSVSRPQRDAFIRFKEICGTSGFTWRRHGAGWPVNGRHPCWFFSLPCICMMGDCLKTHCRHLHRSTLREACTAEHASTGRIAPHFTAVFGRFQSA